MKTLEELNLTGNCLRGARPILCFDNSFSAPHWQVIKELLTQIFGTPNQHPKSQPFIDRVSSFAVLDNRIWWRQYQIVDEVTGDLAEIGPRVTMQPIKIFEGSFGGRVLWENPHYVSPNEVRRMMQLPKRDKYVGKVRNKMVFDAKRLAYEGHTGTAQVADDIFNV